MSVSYQGCEVLIIQGLILYNPLTTIHVCPHYTHIKTTFGRNFMNIIAVIDTILFLNFHSIHCLKSIFLPTGSVKKFLNLLLSGLFVIDHKENLSLDNYKIVCD